jgi:hypothetical protein
MNPSTTSYLVTLAVAILSSGGLQYVLNRKQRKDQERRESKQEEKEEKKDRDDVERREIDRRELLATAQATAQRAALESADQRYVVLEKDYEKCRKGLDNLSQATGLLIDVVETVLVPMQPEVKRAINEARRHLR